MNQSIIESYPDKMAVQNDLSAKEVYEVERGSPERLISQEMPSF